MKLRAKWTGPPPNVGDYLRSPQRPRFAYRICEVSRVDKIVRWDPEVKREFQYYAIAAVRVALDEVPKEVRVHPWTWDKRVPRRDPRLS